MTKGNDTKPPVHQAVDINRSSSSLIGSNAAVSIISSVRMDAKRRKSALTLHAGISKVTGVHDKERTLLNGAIDTKLVVVNVAKKQQKVPRACQAFYA
jgi:hypothetical protein